MDKTTLGLLLALILSGCGGGQVGTVEMDVSGGHDVIDDTTEVASDSKVSETVDHWVPDFAPVDTVGDVDIGICDSGSGCFLYPCTNGDDCLSGLCVAHLGNLVCTEQCTEECPQGFDCLQLAGFEPDIVFACVSPFAHLCRPCNTNSDCSSAAGEDACLVYGPEGRYCGANCTVEEDCPPDYSCIEATTAEGTELSQCVADSGLCPCSDQAVELGLSTTCYQENNYGLCEGSRSCGPDGLTECDAPHAVVEECNGLDDDCNGQVDDLPCDDDNDCTADSCNAEEGCLHDPQSGTDCNDEDVCSLADHCEAGICIGTPIECDDENICTDNGCDPAGGCLFVNNDASCDDSDPCTVDDRCDGGDCSGFSVPCDCQTDSDCIPLEDGDVCNGTLYCDTTLFPQKCAVVAKTVVTCDEPQGVGAECLAAICDPDSGECSLTPANDGIYCNDEDACTVGESCAAGQCSGGVPVNCNDGNICTTDLCDMTDGCSHEANTLPCDDGTVCTVGDLCAESTCVPGQSLSCNDKNVCTSDSCDPAVGCLFANVGGLCDDNNPCTTGDNCADGKCAGAAVLDCDDNNPCTKDICLPDSGCTHLDVSGPCDDLDPCTSGDACGAGLCLPGEATDCDDGNPCTDDSCAAPDGCLNTPNALPCDDGNSCTTDDLCGAGVCVGKGSLECDDDNPCTKDICLPDGGCAYEKTSGFCSDGDPCTINDICKSGQCISGPKVDCDDANPCTDDECGDDGLCIHLGNLAECDDDNPCTAGDHCIEGDCVATGPTDCDDDNVCTNDLCDPTLGCTHTHNALPCDDGTICTLDDKCAEGLCVPGSAMQCDDGNTCTTDACDPLTGCTHTANDTICDDGNACTADDTCTNGFCLGLSLTKCGDNNLCTDDSCNPLTGCANVPNANPCSDGSVCTLNDSCADGVCVPGEELSCDDSSDCTEDSCSPDAGCVNAPLDVACNDGDVCTIDDACINGICVPGGALDCDDDDLCTTDSCDPNSGCANVAVVPCCGNGEVEVDEECDDSNSVAGDGCDANCQKEPQISCKALLALFPETVTGTYSIDPDGAGGNDPFDVHCDMDTDGGGWTRVAAEDFETSTSGWSTTNTITTCGSYGKILGGYNVISGSANAKTYSALGVAHTHARVTLDYIKIDSWDNEWATVKLAGTQIYHHQFCFCSQGCGGASATCGGSAICGGGWDEEHKIAVAAAIAQTSNSIEVYGHSSTDQGASDESWGFDNILLYVR
jgi:cysteine-rich repeat protein